MSEFPYHICPFCDNEVTVRNARVNMCNQCYTLMDAVTVEQWKPMKGYEHIYAVSNLGNIKNIKRGKLLNNRKRCGKNLQVILCTNGVAVCRSLAKLVATHFIDLKGERLHKVTMRDEDKSNVRWDNLITHTVEDTIRHNKIKYKDKVTKNTSKLTKEQVIDIRKEYWSHEDVTMDALAADYGVKYCVISNLITYRTWRDI